ncbi:uncharacterized protein [Ambystoma mexicanum]|uniref:uncharacterized protein isoform X2 n=1 Tax=Ambystoma mexicanum TaxID=8296 RepID=UPI0037E7B0D9
MSESAVRKLQPFTVGTRLSLPKCPDLEPASAMGTLDNGIVHRNLNDRVSLYLARAQAGSRPPCPLAAGIESPPIDAISEEDRINRNALAARAIRKITLSNWRGGPAGATEGVHEGPPPHSERNLNNNNSRGGRDLPRMAGAQREHRPKTQVKVFLRKESEEGDKGIVGNAEKRPRPGATRLPPEIGSPFHMDLGCGSPSPPSRDNLKKQEAPSGTAPGARSCGVPPRLSNLSSHIAQFNREVSQAESWVRGKLRDLKDGCDAQLTPLQDWEQAALTLQREMKDFEDTLSKLSQMAEHLINKQTPNADSMMKQLQALKDQWHVLKQTAMSQSKALGGARTLQEFKQKADQLETWIREKEEKSCLDILPEERSDKIQLARLILDLKQEQQRFRNLQEEVNGLAQKLEKQGRNESKSISARRKHINKLWLKVQGTLTEHHGALQLALEAAAFYQQADVILRAMEAKRGDVCNTGAQVEPEGHVDRDVRDIASQIMMLDVTVSQLISLHPELAQRVTQKHRQVKESWGVLQQAVREDKSALRGLHPSVPREGGPAVTAGSEGSSSLGKQQPGASANGNRPEQRDMDAIGLQRESDAGTEARAALKEPAGLHPAKVVQETGSDVMGGRHNDHKRKKKAVGETEAPKTRPQPEAQLQHFCHAAAQALCWLKENISSSAQWDQAESDENLEEMQSQQVALQQKISRQQARIEAVQQEGKGLVRLAHPGSPRVEGILRELERLWEALKRRNHHRGTVLREAHQAQKVLDELAQMEQWLQDLTCLLTEPAVMRDPELIKRDLQETSNMEAELSTRDTSLRALQEKMGRTPAEGTLFLAEKIQRKMDTVEERFALMRDVLRRRALDLRDSLVLSEFLQNVQMEETLSQKSLLPAAKRRLDFHEPRRLIPSKDAQKQAAAENVDEMAWPLDELQEAVDMLNDAVKERERLMAAEKETGSLAHLLSDVSQRLSAAQSTAQELGRDVLETERDFAVVKSELGLEGLQGLQEKQTSMECHTLEALKVVMGEVETSAARLEELCPGQLQSVGPEIRGALEAWAELQRTVQENQAKLQRASQLRAFFRNYLAMISWTEDTRTQVFSEAIDADGLPTAQREELDRKIEAKFKQFEELADAGRKLIAEEHYLSDTIKERIEELQSMLGWVLVRWRAQKRQKNPAKKKDKKKVKDGQGEVIVDKVTAVPEQPLKADPPETGILPPQEASACFQNPRCSEMTGPRQERQVNQPGSRLPWGSHEWVDFLDPPSLPMDESQEHPSHPSALELGQHHSSLVLDPCETPVMVVPPPGTGSLGETVNLILSISRKVEKERPIQEAEGGEAAEEEDGLHRVCTYLHVKEGDKERKLTCHSLTMPRSSKKNPTRTCSSPAPRPGSDSSVTFHTMPKISPNSLLNSLKRKEKANPEAQRLTVQKIMGESTNSAKKLPEMNVHGTSTWPLKGCRRKARAPSPTAEGFLDYMKNPLVGAIDAECGAVRSALDFSQGDFRCRTAGSAGSQAALGNYGCRHLSLGSVLSLELPKDLTLLGNFQDNIKISPEGPERLGGMREDLQLPSKSPSCWEGSSAMEMEAKSTEPQMWRPKMETVMLERVIEQRAVATEVLTKEKALQKPFPFSEETAQTIDSHGERIQTHAAEVLGSDRLTNMGTKGSTEDLLDFKLNRLSRISVLHEQMDHEWDRLAARMKTSGTRPETQTSCSSKLKEKLTNKRGVNSPKSTTRKLACTVVESKKSEGSISGSRQMCAASHSRGERIEAPKHFSPTFHHTQVGVKPLGQLSVLQYEFGNQDCKSFSPNKALSCVRRTQTPITAEASASIKPKALPQGCPPSTTEVLHPNHELFEEDEEELEGIWKNVERHMGRRGKEAFHAVSTEELERDDVPHTETFEPHHADIPGSQFVMESAPNVLVAKFTLPTAAYVHWKPELKEHPSGDGDESEPCKEMTNQRVPSVNGGVSMLPEGTCPEEQLMPTDRFKAVENETASDAKSPSTSRKDFQLMEGTLEKKHLLQAGGRKSPSTSRKDFQLMEGTLEKKHVLQAGGRKAACRTWSKCHAVLMRRTLCFYQDRKDTIKSSTGAVPLNLAGAFCTLEVEYTKKSHCFRLQMRDGSEVLLRAPSDTLMREWVSKIQQNSGFDEEDFFHAAGRPPEATPSPTIGSLAGTCTGRSSSCHLLGYARPSSVPVKEVTILSRPSARLLWPSANKGGSSEAVSFQMDDPRTSQEALAGRMCAWAPAGSPRLHGAAWCEDEDPALVVNQRRSRSFTSATYQKVTPVSLPAEAFEPRGSYSVTLYIGDQSTPAQRVRRHSLASKDPSASKGRHHQLDWPPDTHRDHQGERSPGSFTPPKNMSVFKKFFRKKD